jgi:hypothetical protein
MNETSEKVDNVTGSNVLQDMLQSNDTNDIGRDGHLFQTNVCTHFFQ